MSVTENYFIPDTPPNANSSVEYQPLGGNGMQAPHAQYAVEVQLEGDASAGNATINIRFDERYCSMIQYLSARISGLAADAAYEFNIAASATDRLIHQANVTNLGVATFDCDTWTPPPYVIVGLRREGSTMNAPFLRFISPNTDGDTYSVIMRVLVFNIRARELTPLPILNSNIVPQGI